MTVLNLLLVDAEFVSLDVFVGAPWSLPVLNNFLRYGFVEGAEILLEMINVIPNGYSFPAVQVLFEFFRMIGWEGTANIIALTFLGSLPDGVALLILVVLAGEDFGLGSCCRGRIRVEWGRFFWVCPF